MGLWVPVLVLGCAGFCRPVGRGWVGYGWAAASAWPHQAATHKPITIPLPPVSTLLLPSAVARCAGGCHAGTTSWAAPGPGSPPARLQPTCWEQPSTFRCRCVMGAERRQLRGVCWPWQAAHSGRGGSTAGATCHADPAVLPLPEACLPPAADPSPPQPPRPVQCVLQRRGADIGYWGNLMVNAVITGFNGSLTTVSTFMTEVRWAGREGSTRWAWRSGACGAALSPPRPRRAAPGAATCAHAPVCRAPLSSPLPRRPAPSSASPRFTHVQLARLSSLQMPNFQLPIQPPPCVPNPKFHFRLSSLRMPSQKTIVPTPTPRCPWAAAS